MTIKQQQHLLAYLDYYQGKVDGLFGPKSKQAVEAFQEDYDGLAVTGVVDLETEQALKHAISNGIAVKKTYWNNIRYFKRDEFQCGCGGQHCNGFPVEPAAKLMQLADKVREHFGVPVIVSSGVRCPKHNAKVGGVTASRHMSGKAMDFCVKGKTSMEVLAYVQKLPEVRYCYAIDGSYVHMDVE